MKVYTETDNLGEHKVIDKENGVKIRILRKPSEEYKAKLQARAEKEKERMAKEKIEQDRNKLITQRMREIAERELKNEGKIEE
jgi:hypothetical protein